MVFFPLYEKLKIYFKDNFEDKNAENLSSKYVVASSVISKIVASAASYPHEVLRSRLMYKVQKLNSNEKREHIIKLTLRIFRQEGPIALYSGFVANLARIVPNYAIFFVLYETLLVLSDSK